MEIDELINPNKLKRFDDFCKQVEIEASRHLNDLHQKTFALLKEDGMSTMPLSIRKQLYKVAMATNNKLVTDKKIAALTIFYLDQILQE